ncbi:MAG: hypothetical protein PWQ41_932 [Bacillota bacterium]|jgi:cell fate (sporulation/competence/biofilm development) regulator YlbF (YheA/YmcA/DUF963 family)|nr:hypothetical protein [Bacillota bacterium]MDK2855846.1 hypothetical protein [Bacillota bacterium]MDK2925158.1 hypothetical protein [Bacillota bacterium]
MEVYDEAHALARNLRASDAFQRLVKAKEALEAQPEKLERVKEFKAREFEVQAQTLAGGKVAEEKLKALQQMADLLLLDPVAREYLESEAKFARLFADVQKIILDAVKEWKPFGMPEAFRAQHDEDKKTEI